VTAEIAFWSYVKRMRIFKKITVEAPKKVKEKERERNGDINQFSSGDLSCGEESEYLTKLT
jgi:hypothetical protein